MGPTCGQVLLAQLDFLQEKPLNSFWVLQIRQLQRRSCKMIPEHGNGGKM